MIHVKTKNPLVPEILALLPRITEAELDEYDAAETDEEREAIVDRVAKRLTSGA